MYIVTSAVFNLTVASVDSLVYDGMIGSWRWWWGGCHDLSYPSFE
uniref:Uncharacterized protein n=1 Tax=Anguilla anguilla TaxID=7936 RepID=A0A0E9WE07_ANGAN